MSAKLQAFMEHRWGRRCPLDLAVRFSAPTVGSWGRVRNLSLSGAYIETAARFPLAQHLLIEMEWKCDGRIEWRSLGAWVVRSDHRGLAVEWTEFAPWPVAALFAGEPAARNPEAAVSEFDDFRLTG